ncbi:MAG: hypothetical protein KAS12_01070, partial [Candidatus Aenigmarchaeota archaeon]|nr:hypothetical protein [Candidatus Aenigmarchaeota archaeon]
MLKLNGFKSRDSAISRSKSLPSKKSNIRKSQAVFKSQATTISVVFVMMFLSAQYIAVAFNPINFTSETNTPTGDFLKSADNLNTTPDKNIKTENSKETNQSKTNQQNTKINLSKNNQNTTQEKIINQENITKTNQV